MRAGGGPVPDGDQPAAGVMAGFPPPPTNAVMARLVPAICPTTSVAWMAGTGPAMTGWGTEVSACRLRSRQ